MQNRVGSVIPSEQDIQKLVRELEGMETRSERYTLTLSAEERLRATKMRANGTPIVELVGSLARRHEVSLPRISVEDMRGDLTLAQRLMPLELVLERFSKRISDTILQAHSECWWATTAFYTSLSRMANIDPELEHALLPAVEFFAKRRRTAPPAQG